MNERARARIMLILAMVIFGSIGIFRRSLPFSSEMIAFCRGVIGMLILLFPSILKRDPATAGGVRKNLWKLLLSGALIGVNWIFLFEAYRYTTVPTATLCYYMAPVFIIAASPFVLKEKLRGRKLVGLLAAVIGMVLVSGLLGPKAQQPGAWKGIAYGLGAAVLYATVILLNKTLSGVSAYQRTCVQLGAAAVIALPYTLVTGGFSLQGASGKDLCLLLLVGVLHTGIAYMLYFGSLPYLSAQTAAIFSYIDPVVAIVLSAAILGERPDLAGAVGAVLILGGTLFSEWEPKKEKSEKNKKICN